MDTLKIGNLIFTKSAAAADMRLESCRIYQETATDSSSLAFDTMTAELFTSTAGAQLCTLPTDTPIVITRGGRVYRTFLKAGVVRTGPATYSLEANSPLSALTKREHRGGIYTGQTVGNVVKGICGGIPVIIESVFAGMQLYGWLPYARPPESSARDNLVQVLFAIGAHLGTDLNGVLRVEKLWDGVAGGAAETYSGGTLRYDADISAVSLTEHQYSPGVEETELFSGTASDGYLITFSEPMHSLSAEGFSIQESGANYARVSAGSGVLKGKKYRHSTRQITADVTPDAAENVVDISNATLVSVTNSQAVAERLAAFYKCRTLLDEGIVSSAEKPGHIIRAYDPYDKAVVECCVEKLDTTLSRTMRSDMTARVGFRPPQPEAAEYYDTRVVLTGSGEWTVPNGVSSARVVLIGGGTGGSSGLPGSTADAGSQPTETSFGTTYYRIWPGKGGAGGQAGAAGDGGKIYQTLLSLIPGTDIAYSCGVGGAGGVFSAAGSTPGTIGGNTTFGNLSSVRGASSEDGFLEEMGGMLYGATGTAGTSGGSGTGLNDEGTDIAQGESVEYNGMAYSPGATDESTINITYPSGAQYVRAVAGNGYGGGAAAGANGNAGKTNKRASVNSAQATIGTGDGGDGADAAAPAAPTLYGTGGSGGNGGGGGGGCGAGVISRDNSVSSVSGISILRYPGNPGAGGRGSDGGDGADGCIILYFRMPKALQPGPLVTSDGKSLLDSLSRRMIV